MATTKKFNIIALSAALFFLILSGVVGKSYDKPKFFIEKQDSAINVNHNILKVFSIGQKRLLTDLLWITTLLESDSSHYKSTDLNNWMFLRFKSITDLDPHFKRAYQFGGKYLSIIKDDLEGAKYIFEKGLEVYPNDYHLIFDAAFLYGFELDDYKKALKLYSKLKSFPNAPGYLPSLISKLKYQVTKDLGTTFILLKEMYEVEPEGTLLKLKFRSDLYAIKAELDLKCLNQNKGQCSRVDFLGDKYLYINGTYKAQREFTPYRLNKR